MSLLIIPAAWRQRITQESLRGNREARLRFRRKYRKNSRGPSKHISMKSSRFSVQSYTNCMTYVVQSEPR